MALTSLAGCKCLSRVTGTAPGGGSGAAPDLPEGALVLQVAYGSEKKTWLEEQARAFEATSPKTASGKPIRIDARAMGSGEAVQAILSGDLKPHVFSPASGAYVSLLNQSWLSVAGRTQPLSPAGEPVVLSPLVIAMWRPMAEALGWPKKQLGWADLLAVNADPQGWGGLGHPEWGRFKLGHTHPGFSNSGLLSVLAEAYAGAKKTRGLSTSDLDGQATRDFVKQVEASIVHYGKSTGFFADKMASRGPAYLSAAVLYENVVVESYARPAPAEIVSIYPVEGTFWSDHPFAVLDAPWVGAEERAAAEAFLAFLKAKPAQQRALALGFRPADPSIPVAAPLDAAHGADPRQPQTLLEVPNAPVLQHLLEAWEQAKRPADVMLVFDKSGSMDGQPLTEAKAGARAFLQSLHESDQAAIAFFDNNLYPPVGAGPLHASRGQLLQQIDAVTAGGGTALYDAIADAYARASERARADPARIHALVVMTDGRDEGSRLALRELQARLGGKGEEVKVFTIAYGDSADPAVLARIAEAAQGQSVAGNARNIVQVYQDMASFF